MCIIFVLLLLVVAIGGYWLLDYFDKDSEGRDNEDGEL